MKNLLLILTFLLIGNILFAKSTIITEKETEKITIISKTNDGVEYSYIVDSENEAETALFCKVKCGSNTYSCFFCDCSSLPKCSEERIGAEEPELALE